MSELRISYFPGGERDREPRGASLTWEQLRDVLGERGVSPSPCDLATCGVGGHEHVWRDRHGVEHRGGCRHKYGAAWSPAVYPPGATRSKGNVGVVTLLVLDLDHATEEELAPVARALSGLRHLVHSSHSDRRPALRHIDGDGWSEPYEVVERALRVVIPLSEPVRAEDWPRFWEAAVEVLGGAADPATCDASRLYFLPTRRSDCEFTFSADDGAPLDVRAVLSRARPAAALPDLAGPSGELGPASPEVIAEARARLLRAGPAVEGEGGDRRTYSACAALLHGYALSEEEAWPLLLEWNETCRPPWSREELRLKMSNAAQYAEGRRGEERRVVEGAAAVAEMFGPGPASVEVPDEDDVLSVLRGPGGPAAPPAERGTWAGELGAARSEVARALASGRGDAPAVEAEQRLFQPVADLLSVPAPAASWLVERLLTEGGVSMIAGEPKSTKSWMAIDVALCVSSGRDVLGKYRVPRPRPVAYFFAEEHVESVVSRVRAFAAGHGVRPEDLARQFYAQPRGKYLDLSKDEDVARVVASARMIGQPLGLLVLDPLRDVHTGKENESDDMSAVFKRLRLISVMLDCAVLVVHHAKKPTKEGATNGNEIRGSSVINAALDARIVMKDLRGDGECVLTTTLETVVKRGRSAGVFEATLRLVDGEDHVATSARWSTQTRGEASAAAEVEVAGAQVEDTAVAALRHLLLLEARHEPMPPVKKLLEALRPCGMNRLYAALSLAGGKLWVTRRGDRYHPTDVGRRYVADVDGPAAPPAPTTLAEVLARHEARAE